ncbi:MAG: 30S ribosomal protein S21 [candidate division WOR-3 bacterium]
MAAEFEDLERMLKRLKRDFQQNVQPELKKHAHFISKSERERMKRAKAIRKLRRKLKKMTQAA